MSSIIKYLNIGNGDIKVVVKDTIDIEGTITTAASKAFEHNPKALVNAQVVTNILENNCRIVGKANLHELAFGVTGVNELTGTPINPHYPELIPGGSSSGSATAVAEKLCDFSIGTDTGGSIRLPAACCGIYGLKPTFGRVSRQGILPESSTLDCVGPFANEMTMLIQAMTIIDPTFSSEKLLFNQNIKPRIGVLKVHADKFIWQSIEKLMNQVENIQFEEIELNLFQAAHEAGMTLISYENWQSFSYLIHTEKLGPDVYKRLTSSVNITLDQYKKAQEIQSQFKQELEQILQEFDAVLLPTLPIIPPKVSEITDSLKLLNLTAYVRPFNVSGHPAISIPLQTEQAEPVGLQLVSGLNQDEKLCAIAQLFEKYIKD
ncbi:amidase [Acinetobacter schindleri]|uniref:amidase n=1 Tax=Acinetobacter schindleri TaxID=108981 RepID=UPI0013B09396|nr:amidase [Acinetobacter schindleri]QIC62246.1 amidase [Acinetobacter schindleri]